MPSSKVFPIHVDYQGLAGVDYSQHWISPLYMMVSSVNSQHLEFTCSGMPLMKVRKRIGPNTLPCGTPDVTAASSEH